MKLVTFSGPPSSGKTSVIIHSANALKRSGLKVGVAKFDCLATEDDAVYAGFGIPVQVGLSGGLCPDHYFACNIEECFNWAKAENLDVLISESAGLCNRCSPHLHGVMAVCVIDNLMGANTPRKIGPMLKMADVVVITKGDVVSQAEREVFAFRVRQSNSKGVIMHLNGITGQGCEELAELIESFQSSDEDGMRLRFNMPAALCSYCLGETKIGSEYLFGNIRKMEIK